MWDQIVSVPEHCLSFYFMLSVHKMLKNEVFPVLLTQPTFDHRRQY